MRRPLDSIYAYEAYYEFGQPVNFFDLPGAPAEDHAGYQLTNCDESEDHHIAITNVF